MNFSWWDWFVEFNLLLTVTVLIRLWSADGTGWKSVITVMETDFNKEIKRWMMLLLLHQSALRYWEGVWLVLLFWWRRRKRQSSLGFIVWGRRRSERRRRSVWWTTELLAWRTTGRLKSNWKICREIFIFTTTVVILLSADQTSTWTEFFFFSGFSQTWCFTAE